MWTGVSASMLRTSILINICDDRFYTLFCYVGVGSAAQLSTFSKSREVIGNLQVIFTKFLAKVFVYR